MNSIDFITIFFLYLLGWGFSWGVFVNHDWDMEAAFLGFSLLAYHIYYMGDV